MNKLQSSSLQKKAFFSTLAFDQVTPPFWKSDSALANQDHKRYLKLPAFSDLTPTYNLTPPYFTYDVEVVRSRDYKMLRMRRGCVWRSLAQLSQGQFHMKSLALRHKNFPRSEQITMKAGTICMESILKKLFLFIFLTMILFFDAVGEVGDLFLKDQSTCCFLRTGHPISKCQAQQNHLFRNMVAAASLAPR